ncbi:M20 family peptidase [Flammeovirga aprica]|uniref:M20/M25/M40 family metallo-hydrolase n=1 Tax=Flammeovirga aprica JL-4 TaxID=694437 RepID=A0A7X9NZP3_9BACT|nr:M20 family peptidase [Flammeovirga aprica]NME66833.1 M20/M25/M40 family metallo-hydrolase [Flammeovirga aprica JL-4]
MKRFVGILSGTITIASLYIFGNLFFFDSRQSKISRLDSDYVSDSAKYHLSEAIQIKTVSYDDPDLIDSSEFVKFNNFLQLTYPTVFQNTEYHLFGTFSYLIKWKGSDSSLKPIVLMSHFDVVPALEENRSEWKYPPFSGAIKDGVIWGRGAIDDKVGVIGILEAVQTLMKSGFQPKRTVYMAFGHDEEINGLHGANAMAHYLKQQGVEAEFVLDEGGYITQGLVPGMEKDVALVGTTEKGFLTVELSTDIEGGHASMPKKESAISVLTKAVNDVVDNPFPSYISPPLKDFIDFVGPEMPFGLRTVFANSTLLEPVLMSVYEKSPSSNALVRTTIAPTIINAGMKSNVLPKKAHAVLNIRILPGETVDYVFESIKKKVNNEEVKLRILNKSEAAPISDAYSDSFKLLDQSIKETFGDIVVSPYIMIAASDSRHYSEISQNILRFCPFHLNKENLDTIHGENERIGVVEFENSIRFYQQLIKNTTN